MEHGTRQPAAYDYYLRTRGYLQDNQKPESIQSAINMFRRALELDRKFEPVQVRQGFGLAR